MRHGAERLRQEIGGRRRVLAKMDLKGESWAGGAVISSPGIPGWEASPRSGQPGERRCRIPARLQLCRLGGTICWESSQLSPAAPEGTDVPAEREGKVFPWSSSAPSLESRSYRSGPCEAAFKTSAKLPVCKQDVLRGQAGFFCGTGRNCGHFYSPFGCFGSVGRVQRCEEAVGGSAGPARSQALLRGSPGTC